MVSIFSVMAEKEVGYYDDGSFILKTVNIYKIYTNNEAEKTNILNSKIHFFLI
jgi:hypothetical protein